MIVNSVLTTHFTLRTLANFTSISLLMVDPGSVLWRINCNLRSWNRNIPSVTYRLTFSIFRSISSVFHYFINIFKKITDNYGPRFTSNFLYQRAGKTATLIINSLQTLTNLPCGTSLQQESFVKAIQLLICLS